MVKAARPRIAPTAMEAVGGLKHVDSGGRSQVNDSKGERVIMESMVASSARDCITYYSA